MPQIRFFLTWHYSKFNKCNKCNVIIYKPGPDLYITGYLSRNNHSEEKGPENHWHEYKCKCHQYKSKYTVCTSIKDIQVATIEDAYLQKMKSHIIHGWPHKKLIKA